MRTRIADLPLDDRSAGRAGPVKPSPRRRLPPRRRSQALLAAALGLIAATAHGQQRPRLNIQHDELYNIEVLGVAPPTSNPPLRIQSATFVAHTGEVLPDVVAVTQDLCFALSPNAPLDSEQPGQLTLGLTDDTGQLPPLIVDLFIGGPTPTADDCRDPAPPVPSDNPVNVSTDEDRPTTITGLTLLGSARDPNVDDPFMTSGSWAVVSTTGGTSAIVPDANDPSGQSLQFTPTKDQFGQATIRYRVKDVDGDESAELVAVVQIVPQPDAPTANSSTCSVGPEGNACLLDYSDPDGQDPNAQLSIQTQPTGGFVDVETFNGTAVIYVPNPSTSADSFEYVIIDGDGLTSNVARVDIVVEESADPVAVLEVRTADGTVIGAGQSIADSDGIAGEIVTLDGEGSLPGVPPESITAYHWTVNGQPLTETTASVEVSLPDGDNTVQLVVEDQQQRSSAPATRTVTVLAADNSSPTARIAIGGTVRTGQVAIPNSDFEPGETVTFDGSQSTDPDEDAIVEYVWSLNGEEIARGTDAAIQLDLQDGANTVTLVVTDERGSSGQSTITALVDADPDLSTLSGLTPGERAVGGAISELCPRLNAMTGLTSAQGELLDRCTDILRDDDPDRQRAALDALTPEEMTAQQTTGIDFSTSQLANLSSRLVALRQGIGGGVSIAGLSLRDKHGTPIPLQQLAELAKFFIGGASGDEDDPAAESIAARWGIFVNGNIVDGEKDETANEAGYDFDAWGVTAGFDYRVTDQLILGLALGYNESEAGFANDAGSLDSEGVSTSVYGTYFNENLYFDFIGTNGSLDYDSVRRIVYADADGVNDDTAFGATSGDLSSFGASFGYDFARGGWRFGPTLALTRMEVDIDPFAETGAGENGGLNLAFDKQNAESRTVQGGFRADFAISRPWGVLSPQMRLAFVRELENDSQLLQVRFVNDPFTNDPTQPSPGAITIVTDEPDEEYVRWGVGVTFVRANGVSAFVDYESLAGYDSVTSHELTFGVRFEKSFR